jgi:syntaxin 16
MSFPCDNDTGHLLDVQSQSQLQSQATTALDIDLDARTKEITQIATSISELADLFRDLSAMVVEQGTVLDSVEYNVQQTARELVAAEGELKVAQRYQANTGRRKCILFLILLIVGLIIVLIYKPRGGGGTEKHTADSIATVHLSTIFTSAEASATATRSRIHLAKPPPLPTRPIIGDVE